MACETLSSSRVTSLTSSNITYLSSSITIPIIIITINRDTSSTGIHHPKINRITTTSTTTITMTCITIITRNRTVLTCHIRILRKISSRTRLVTCVLRHQIIRDCRIAVFELENECYPVHGCERVIAIRLYFCVYC